MAFAAPLLLAAGAGGGAAVAGGSLATALAVGGTALSGLSAYQSAKYQAAVARNNAQIAAENQQRASDTAQEQQRRADIEAAADVGSVIAAQSASGLDVLGRSQLAVRRRTYLAGRTAAEDIRKQGETDIRNLQRQEQGFRAEQQNANRAGTNALISTAFGVAGDLRKGGVIGGSTPSSLVGASRSTRKRRFN